MTRNITEIIGYVSSAQTVAQLLDILFVILDLKSKDVERLERK